MSLLWPGLVFLLILLLSAVPEANDDSTCMKKIFVIITVNVINMKDGCFWEFLYEVCLDYRTFCRLSLDFSRFLNLSAFL